MFTPQERLIFGPYFNGAEQVYADPIRVYHRLVAALDGDPNAWLKRFGEPLDTEARDKVINAAGWSLEMVPFDKKTGQGATEAEVETVLRGYLEWLRGNVRPEANSATSSPPSPACSVAPPPILSGSSSG